MTTNVRCAPWACGFFVTVLAFAVAGCGRAGGAPETRTASDEKIELPPDGTPATDNANARATGGQSVAVEEPLDLGRRLERLRAQGSFEEFIDQAIRAAESDPSTSNTQLLASEAYLASGLPAQSARAAEQAATLAAEEGELERCAAALKLWTVARCRQGQPLDAPFVAELLPQLPADDARVRTLWFWREHLGSRRPYRCATTATKPVELQPADVSPGSIPFELATIQARAGGTALPLVFIDTGAQHTLITTEAARAAGVVLGEGRTQLVGFRGLTATPGVIETLELGDLVLYDVPVLVGDSAPLVALAGQMSLGSELMHHVRFHIDYPARRVTAEPARGAGTEPLDPPIWEIPIWTFSQIGLAGGQLGAGPKARVLVDTGNGTGTFVSYRWARRNLPQVRSTTSSLVFRLKKRSLVLDQFDLGSQTLSTWPITDTMPPELDRLNQMDVIVGHDLLWPYRLTIDMPGRVFELRPGTKPQR